MHKGDGKPKWWVYILKNPLIGLTIITLVGTYIVNKIFETINLYKSLKTFE